MIIDAVLHTWMARARYATTLSCFYADDGLLENSDPDLLQRDLDAIIKLFGKVGLKANEEKTKFMIVRGAPAPEVLSTEVYQNIRRNRRVRYNREDQHGGGRRTWVECPVCRKGMQRASLKRHIKWIHPGHVPMPYRYTPISQPPRVFTMSSFTKGRHNACPVPQCPGGGRDKFGVYRHYAFRHPNDEIIIAEDGILPKCDQCGMQTIDIATHYNSTTCKKGMRQRENAEKRKTQALAEHVQFTVNDKPIQQVRKFRYLGRVFHERNNDSLCIQENLQKARAR